MCFQAFSPIILNTTSLDFLKLNCIKVVFFSDANCSNANEELLYSRYTHNVVLLPPLVSVDGLQWTMIFAEYLESKYGKYNNWRLRSLH